MQTWFWTRGPGVRKQVQIVVKRKIYKKRQMNKMKKKFKLPIKMRPQKQNSKIY